MEEVIGSVGEMCSKSLGYVEVKFWKTTRCVRLPGTGGAAVRVLTTQEVETREGG